MKSARRISYTVLVVPDDKGKTFSFAVNGALVRSFLVFVVLLATGIGVLLFIAGAIGVRLQMVDVLRKENTRLTKDNESLRVIAAKLETMEKLAVYLQQLTAVADAQDAGGSSTTGSGSATTDVLNEDSVAAYLSDSRRATAEDLRPMDESSGVAAEFLLQAIPNIRPVEGWITRQFVGKNIDAANEHSGVDFAATVGSLIRATAPGTVDVVVHDKYFGLLVVVKHNFGFETRYGHCSQILVSKGDAVERGQTIALVGNTGASSGPHLHYEVLRNGRPMDPLRYMLSRAAMR